jgi:hypothetical protein
MKNATLLIIVSILTLSCSKDIFEDKIGNCIKDIKIPYKKVPDDAKCYFSGKVRNDSICIYNGDGDYEFSLRQYTRIESLPGEWINPADTSKVSGIGILLSFHNEDYSSFFEIESPVYDKNTDLVKMIDDIGKNEFLKIGDNHIRINDGYSLCWLNKCDLNDDYYLAINSGFSWVDAYYYDQYRKWIKVKSFEKKTYANNILYEILLDINVNLFSQRGYYGELKGEFKAYFAIPN